MAPAPPVPTVFVVTVIDGVSTFICIGAICTFGAQTPVVTGSVGTATITAADVTPLNLVTRLGWKTITVTLYDPTLGVITVDMAFTTYMAFTIDSGSPGGMDPNNIIFAAVGAGNCVLRSNGIFTVDDGMGNIIIRSDIDGLYYTAHINYATGEVTFTTPPPDGTTIYRPTA